MSNKLPVIKVPLKYVAQMEKVEKLKSVKKLKTKLANIQGGNKKIPIITCKNKKLNFFKGQTYLRDQKVPLASELWFGRKSSGDHFTIHANGTNPSFLNLENRPSFEALGLHPLICGSFKNIGFHHPTNIQALAIPKILEGSNTIISAETGNGKTYTFLAPLIQDILQIKQSVQNDTELNSERLNAPMALVIVPGRELVTQTVEMARTLCNDLDIQVTALIGGRTKRLMTNARVIPTDILISSFGALSKMVHTGIYNIEMVRHIVLDEADTLLDDSFIEKVKYFLKKFALKGKSHEDDDSADTLAGAQLTLVGATFPTNVETSLGDIVEVDSLVHVKTPYLHRVLPHVTQTFFRVPHSDVAEKLLRIAKVNYKQKIPTLIFCNNSEKSNWVSLFLNSNDIPCTNLNSSVPRPLRRKMFDYFQDGSHLIMSCTDLCSRGLNTIKAAHIVNLDFPQHMADYIHRCGRTGRVGSTSKNCNVFNFIKKYDAQLVNKIEYSVRKQELLPNVDGNIKQIITSKRTVDEEEQFAIEY